MLIYGEVTVPPLSTLKLSDYTVPTNCFYKLESVIPWTSADAHFIIRCNSIQISSIRFSGFTQTKQVFFNEELSPLDRLTVYGCHGQSRDRILGCTLIFKQL